MINYRETKRTTLKILEPEFTELFNRLAINEEEMTFQRPIDKDSDIRTFSVLTLLETLAYPIPVHIGDIKTEGSLLERKITLNNLRSKSKLARDEQGTNILYLSFGFIEWKENNSASAGWLKSPVLMMPVSLKLESISAPFTLSRYDDEIEVNPTLDYLFNERYGVDLPMFELKDEDSIEQYMQTIEEIADKNGWKLTREIRLGLLSFLKISMYHDINNSYNRMIRNPVVRAITGNTEAVNNIPSELNCFDYDLVSPGDCYQVINADSSQQEAITLSKAGVSFVMQGPPGTGKSQTITNIIAEALADGKKVLFVSEKAAALEVVYKRLTEVGLSDFCLTLHSHKANKKEILDSIAANFKLTRSRIKESVMAELSELFHDRQLLNQYVRELHDEILPLEKSLYETFGKLTALNVTPSVLFDLESPASVSAADYHKMLYNVSNYAKALSNLDVRFSENPWNGTNVKQLDERLRNNLFQHVSGIADKIHALHSDLMSFQNEFGLEGFSSWAYVNQMVSLLCLFENLPLFHKAWADKDTRNKALLTAMERNDLLSRYHSGKSIILETFDESVFEIDIDELLISMRNALESIHSVHSYSSFSDADIMSATPATTEKLNTAITEIEVLVTAYKKLEEATDIYAPCTDANIRTLRTVCVMLASSPIVPSNWFDKEGFDNAKKLLEDAETRSTRLIKVRTEVLECYTDSVLMIDTTVYLDRFTNLYTDSVKGLIIQYENDLSSLEKMWKGNTSLEHDVAIKLFEALVKINRLNVELYKNDSELSARFANEYKGIDTHWKTIDILFEQINEQVEKAQVASKDITSSRESILSNWESGVFDIDAEAMLLRFRTKYTSFIKFLKASYRKDMLLLKGQYKVFGAKLTDAIIVALLQDLKAIAEKEQHLSQETSLLAKHFSQEYIGYRTDWNSLRTVYEQMTAIKDKVSALTGEMKSMRKPILERWTADVFTTNLTEIEQMQTRFSNEYTPTFYETMRQYKEDVDLFVSMRAKDKKSPDDESIVRLLHNIITIIDEMRWFESDTHNFIVKTFGDDFTGYKTKWETISTKIRFVGSLFDELGCDTMSDTIMNIISDKLIHDKECPAIAETLELIANDELSILQRELGKKRRVMPLRKLFKAIPNLLLKLKPCLMMSPLSVAYFLEAESYEFDTVIFDEASQIFPQDAIGAIFRGKQVIIAGDSKQLPPTNFFATSTSNSDDDYDNEYEDEQGNEIFDSILEETTGVLPNKRLLWHYRSRHENLIAFSNQGIYDNDLITFPSSIEAAHDTGVEFVFVEDGIYEGKGRNTGEARRCVELVKAHIERHPNRSLGIIAFSESQQKTILNEIQKFREQNPEYEDFFAEGKEDEFFVKNLENVQGDERDTIIFSVSYAKTKDQRDNNKEMAMRFGPLGQKGGERRLNVAITRAKHNVKLVSSIVPSDISLSRTESEGVRMLRSYIEFAMKGSGILQAAQNADENDTFMNIVSEFLVSQGYKLKKYVGCSGYKIDIAITHPEIETCFIAGIECDGFSYKGAKTARDRDHLRKSILQSMGWNIYRVWSPEWLVRPEIEKQKLITFIEDAIAEYTHQPTEEKQLAKPYENTATLTEIVSKEEFSGSPNSISANGNGNPYGFMNYVEAIWHETPDIMSYSGDSRVAEEIKYVVSIEQPIYSDLLYQRMAGAFGNQKATAPIRNAVERILNSTKLKGIVNKDKDGFVSMSGFDKLTVRIPSPGSTARQISFISPDEIGLAMTTIASQAIGISTDDLIEATVRALGYARKGERMMGCMNKALERLVKAERVKIIDGKVNVVANKEGVRNTSGANTSIFSEKRLLCSKCGVTNIEGDTYCGKCGNEIIRR